LTISFFFFFFFFFDFPAVEKKKKKVESQMSESQGAQSSQAALSALATTSNTASSTGASSTTKSDATHVARVCVLRCAELDLLDEFATIFQEFSSSSSAAPTASASAATSASTAASATTSSANNASMMESVGGVALSSGSAVSDMSVAFSLGKQRYVARIDGLHLASASATCVALDFATAFPYLHSVKSPSDELRILLQTAKAAPGAKKTRGAKHSYTTLAYASVDLAELLQAPADGVVTLFRVIRADKRSVRARLRNTAAGQSASLGPTSSASLGAGGASAAATAAAAAEMARSLVAQSAASQSSAATAAQSSSLRAASDAASMASAADIELDDSDEERDVNWTDVDGTAVGRDTGNKHDTLGAPVARLRLRIATVAAGNERADEFEDAADQLDEGGAVPAPRDDVLPEAIGADEDDQLVASLSLADRIRYRVENNTKGGEKGPGKFRKWATKLRKRPTVDEKRQSKEPAAWILSDDDASADADDTPPRSAPLAIHAEPLGAAGGESPVDQFDNALSDVDDDSSGAYRRAVGSGSGGVAAGNPLLSSGGNDDPDDNDADDGIGAVAAITRVGKTDVGAKRSSKSLMTTSKAPPALNLWKASERSSLALLNIGRRSAAVVVELWRASPALADALPLMTYKDSSELMTVLAGAIDKRDETAQRVDSDAPALGDDCRRRQGCERCGAAVSRDCRQEAPHLAGGRVLVGADRSTARLGDADCQSRCHVSRALLLG
jgi:hypothetical protein